MSPGAGDELRDAFAKALDRFVSAFWSVLALVRIVGFDFAFVVLLGCMVVVGRILWKGLWSPKTGIAVGSWLLLTKLILTILFIAEVGFMIWILVHAYYEPPPLPFSFE